MRGQSEKVGVCKPTREASPQTNLAGIWISDSQHPQLGESEFLLCKPPACGFFLRAPGAGEDTPGPGNQTSGV